MAPRPFTLIPVFVTLSVPLAAACCLPAPFCSGLGEVFRIRKRLAPFGSSGRSSGFTVENASGSFTGTVALSRDPDEPERLEEEWRRRRFSFLDFDLFCPSPASPSSSLFFLLRMSWPQLEMSTSWMGRLLEFTSNFSMRVMRFWPEITCNYMASFTI